ncbi:hypothetical protein RhiJN_02610 [Ceratobasidium sp. AG-Ba]|nr:hypothetical protein RhiJN_02610 [Ceratobasidium sp. AG-Ba]
MDDQHNTLATVLPDESLVVAEGEHSLGLYLVRLKQISRHPLQRELDLTWVDALHKHFLDVGIDRVAHPIKVLLLPSQDNHTLYRSLPGRQPEWLPDDLQVLVYHGQHRVASCQLLNDSEEHWWFAHVHSNGQTKSYTSPDPFTEFGLKTALAEKYPAEFITSMHMSNEEEHRLIPCDATRFLALYNLLDLNRAGSISKEVYQANSNRILRSVLTESTRRGLSNLIASDELADSVACVLKDSHIRGSFNAGSWGKKLVKGRFFKLAACLVEEMSEQCRLLVDGQSEVPSKALLLSATACSIKALEKGVKKKGHAWGGLPGGAEAALARVRARSPGFATVLNPSGSDGWTFPETASVTGLNKETMLMIGSLKDMYNLMQHIIHVTAGRVLLDKYMGNSAHAAHDDHPFGILCIVLNDKFAGKVTNFPHKIIYTMWQQRGALLQELKTYAMPAAIDADLSHYSMLIKKSQKWWEVFRMFKISQFAGQKLKIPKTFDVLSDDRKEKLLKSMQKKRQRDQDCASTEQHSDSDPVVEPPITRQRLRRLSSSSELIPDHEDDGPESQPSKLPRPEQVLHQPSGAVNNCPVNSHQEEEAVAVLSLYPEEPSGATSHQTLREEIGQLSIDADVWSSSEAALLGSLLREIRDLKGQPHAGRVLATVQDKIKQYSHRAQHAQNMSMRAEEHWDQDI